MKILFIAPYVTNNTVPLLSKCKAGFGYMVYDIAKGVAAVENVDILLRNYRYDSFEIDRIHFLSNKAKDFLGNIKYISSIKIPFKLWYKYKIRFREVVRLFYVWLSSGYYYSIIKNNNYDIVHIHGCGWSDELYMDVCKRNNQKFIITLHGLNSFSESVNISPAGKKYERDFLKRVVNGEFPITVISSGIKRTVLDEYQRIECNNITVICNSFSFPKSDGGGQLL